MGQVPVQGDEETAADDHGGQRDDVEQPHPQASGDPRQPEQVVGVREAITPLDRAARQLQDRAQPANSRNHADE